MDVQGKMFLPCRTPQDPWWRAPSYLGVTFWVTHESWSTIVTTKLWFSGEGWPASVNLVISITSLIIKKQNKTKVNQYKQTVQKCWMLSKASIYFCDRYEPQKKSKNEERKKKKKAGWQMLMYSSSCYNTLLDSFFHPYARNNWPKARLFYCNFWQIQSISIIYNYAFACVFPLQASLPNCQVQIGLCHIIIQNTFSKWCRSKILEENNTSMKLHS